MKTGNTHPSGFATPAENETAVNAAEGAGGGDFDEKRGE